MSNTEQNQDQHQEAVSPVLEDDQVTIESGDTAQTADPASGDAQARIDALEEELIGAKETALRAAADAQNVRRRAEQDVEKAHKFGLEKLINNLLPVVDNLERAIEAFSADGADPVVLGEGVELTLKSFVDAMTSHKVAVVNPEGEPFDPQLHQAISAVPNPEVEPNTVLNVVQKGYTLHGRLVRPAMVVVSKAES